MKINSQTYKKKTAAITLLTVLILISLFIFITHKYSFFPFKANTDTQSQTQSDIREGINYDTPTPDQKSAGEDTKKSTATDPDQEGGNQNTQTIQATFTAIVQNDNTIQIRALIDKISNSGVCTLTLSKDGKSVVKTASVQALPNESTCQGFNVPVSELSAGSWKANLSVEIDGSYGNTSETFVVK